MAAKTYIASVSENGETTQRRFTHVNVKDNLTDDEAARFFEKGHQGCTVSTIKNVGDLNQQQLNDLMKSVPGFVEEPKP